MSESLIARERKNYHQRLLEQGVLTIDKDGFPSNADKASKLSVAIARGIADRLMAETHEKSVGQTSGAKFEGLPILHASVSAKWTMRSDRAQNSRTEALNLIRNRKGNLPHIVVVTGEPMPARIASLALGTGDIDCVYHFALYELVESVKELDAEDAMEMLNVLIDGKRLKDISDLPLDLAV